jgi:hypothetical protein
MSRDNFPANVIDLLSKRVACRCSNPDCGRITAGPNSDPAKWVNVGVAAHITAAAPGGERYDPALTPEQRKAPENGIWLCQTCSKLIDSDSTKYTVDLLNRWKADSEAETERMLTRGSVPDINGLPLTVSEPIRIGIRGHVQTDDGTRLPLAPLEDPDSDPTFYGSAYVFRLVLRPVQTTTPTVIQAIGAEVTGVAPIPSFRPLMGVYPTALSLYCLPFDDPKQAGTNRFLAHHYYRVRTDDKAEALPFQPVALDPHLPETFDVRLSPKSFGLFTLRVFALVSVGTTVTEQDLVPTLTVLVPNYEG